jgi:hypothetical protein
MRILFLFIGCLFLQITHAQISISGKVISNESGEPLSGASVYLNNTTIGTTTNSQGDFVLRVPEHGLFEIVVSFVSYEVIVHAVTVTDKDLRFVFRLNAKPKDMRSILIMNDERRKRMMDLFRSQFLGITTAGLKSSIRNESEVYFSAGDGKKDAYAHSDKPLEVINREFGYRIFFDLQEFYVDEETGRTYFAGFARYTELDSPVAKRYIKKRREYYYGSTMHLFHSLYDGVAEEQQFRFFKKMRISNNGSVKLVKNPISAFSLVFKDSVTGQKYLSWDDKITVQYLKDPVYKDALAQKTMISGYMPTGIESDLIMLTKPVFFSELGLLETPLHIAYSGFWSYEKFGNMLPINYRPEP